MDRDLQLAYARLRRAAHQLQDANGALDAAEREHRLALELVDIYERRVVSSGMGGSADSASESQT